MNDRARTKPRRVDGMKLREGRWEAIDVRCLVVNHPRCWVAGNKDRFAESVAGTCAPLEVFGFRESDAVEVLRAESLVASTRLKLG